MRNVRSPRIKKQLSLARDRRNVYGESPHGSRKAIPRNQTTRRRRERRVAAALLSQVTGAGADRIETIDGDVKSRMRLKRKSGFRKSQDMPLGLVIQRDLAYRKARRAFKA